MYGYFEKLRENQMDEANKHPFDIRCRRCDSHNIMVVPYDHNDLGIKCNSCGTFLSCGTYHTAIGDYSGMTEV